MFKRFKNSQKAKAHPVVMGHITGNITYGLSKDWVDDDSNNNVPYKILSILEAGKQKLDYSLTSHTVWFI